MRLPGRTGKTFPGQKAASLWLCCLCLPSPSTTAADYTKNAGQAFSLNTGSFIYHAYAPTETFTQYFENRFVAIERRLPGDVVDSVVIGTFLNSYGDRCALLGVQKNWLHLNERTTLEGVYAYAGEFFLDAFSDCGRSGPYNDLRRATGVGFAPYLYHGIEYDYSRHVSLEAGAILPGVLVMTVQWHF